MGSPWCPLRLARHQHVGLLFVGISFHRTPCTGFKSQNLLPCTLLSFSKSTFCTEQPARQPLFITFLLSSYWLPAGKSSLYLTSKFEAIFLVYFHTGTDSIFHAQVHTVPPVCKLTSHRNLSKAHLCSLGKAPGPGNPGDLMETFTLLP